VESWFRSNHHRLGLLSTAFVEIGVGNAISKSYVYDPTNTLRFIGCVLNPSSGLDTNSRGVAPIGWTGVYPLDNATGINPSGYPGTLDGMAASIHFETTSSMSIASFTQRKVSDGAMVIGTIDNTITKSQAYFIPTAKLGALTQYEANFQGSELTSAQ
jgi:hypothetical protein